MRGGRTITHEFLPLIRTQQSYAHLCYPPLSLTNIAVTSLTKFGFWLTDIAAQYSALDSHQSNVRNVFARSLIENGRHGTPGVTIHREFVQHAYLLAANASEYIKSTALYIFLGMGPGLGILLVGLMLPILVSIHQARTGLVSSLLDLPNLVVSQLRSQAVRRRQEIRAGEEDDDAGDDSDEEADPLQGVAGGNVDGGEDGDGFDADVDWNKIIQLDALMVARAAKYAARSRDKATKSTTSYASSSERHSRAGKASPQLAAGSSGSSSTATATSGTRFSLTIPGGGATGAHLQSDRDVHSGSTNSSSSSWWGCSRRLFGSGGVSIVLRQGWKAAPKHRPHRQSYKSALSLDECVAYPLYSGSR